MFQDHIKTALRKPDLENCGSKESAKDKLCTHCILSKNTFNTVIN